MKPVYTVALCTHNHSDRLERTLAEFAKIREPKSDWEFLVIDNASRDATPELLARHVWPAGWVVRVVREAQLGIANARNRAIAEARGEYIIFLDDDESADPDWLLAYERLVQEHAPDAFGGRIDVLFEDARPPWLSNELLGFLGKLDWGEKVKLLNDLSTPLYTGNFGFRSSIIEQIGLFDASLGRRGKENNGGEDVDFYRRIIRAGLKVWWMPDAVIFHRIQAEKLSRGYFRDLHYRQGRMEAIRRRGAASRVPPNYFYGQLLRSVGSVWKAFRAGGCNATLRSEMNVVYFLGHILGWAFGPRA